MTSSEVKEYINGLGKEYVQALDAAAAELHARMGQRFLHGTFKDGREVIKEKYKFEGAGEFRRELVKYLNNLRNEE